jgi:hypothetical protein
VKRLSKAEEKVHMDINHESMAINFVGVTKIDIAKCKIRNI